MEESEGPSIRNVFEPINTMFLLITIFQAERLSLLQSTMEGPSLLAQDDNFIILYLQGFNGITCIPLQTIFITFCILCSIYNVFMIYSGPSNLCR